MPVLKGNTNVNLALDGFNIPSMIKSIILSNKEEFPIYLTLYIQEAELDDIAITAVGYRLLHGQAYIRDIPILVRPFNNIYIETTGSVDYYITIE
jgi:hypothetical protein